MKQELALNILKSGQNVFLTGQAGAGKTYVINQYIQWLRSCKIDVAITASTGIAATHIGGRTIHSRSGIGIKKQLTDRDMELIQQKEYLYKSINKAHVLIIDEISMISADTLDMIDRVVQMIRRDGRPFGGMQVILVGDFFQLPPVTPHLSGEHKRFAFWSKARKTLELQICYLSSQYRQSDNLFWKLLNELRIGELSEHSLAILRSKTQQNPKKEKSVRLYTHNRDVDAINEQELAKLTTTSYQYPAIRSGDKKTSASLMKSMLTPEILELKVGAPVLFVKNNPNKWYYNGTTGEVIDIQAGTQHPIVKTKDGDIITVEPETRSIENADTILASVKQYPLKLARAITIHKSQGMTLDSAEIDLSNVFEAGQWYVALSRLRDLDRLSLLGINEDGLRAHPLVVRADKYFQEESQVLEQYYTEWDMSMFTVLHQRFVELAWGSYVETSRPQDKKILNTDKTTKKWDTYRITLEYIEQWKSLEDIAKVRELALTTIEWHLQKIATLFPEADLSRFRPDTTTLNLVQAAITKSKQEGNCTEDGYVRLKTIYDVLNGSMSYGTIRRCMIYL